MRTRPDKLTELALPHGTVQVDEHGYLTDPAAWTEDFAAHAAAAEGVTLSAAHWAVIRFMREFHEAHEVAPDQRFVLRDIARREGLDKAAARRRIYDLFPYGYVRQACKIAGMRQPRAWSTG